MVAKAGGELSLTFTETTATESFSACLDHVMAGGRWRRVTLAFDEIEWLIPGTCRDQHWNDEFLDFWQVIRSVQSKRTGLSIVVAGVSPAVAEVNRFDQFQNPLFGIVTPIFLAGLKSDETSDMVQKIGKLMGVAFSPEALKSLFDQYGGHPLLTRLACSNIAELAKASATQFPHRIGRGALQEQSALRDGELIFYVRHVVDELERFYPSEYNILEMLALDDYQSFRAATVRSDAAIHLFRYGVVSNPEYPYITYDVLREYVAHENARREGRPWRFRLVPPGERVEFLRLRVKGIAEDLRELDVLTKRQAKPLLFGPNSFPEGEKLMELSPPNDEHSLGSALSVLNRCFVESVERYGASLGQERYFWTVIKGQYPDLHEALHRIKVYRHNSHHLELTPNAERSLKTFLELDLDDAIAQSHERYWWLFQRCLDALFNAIQRETARAEADRAA